MGTQYARLEQFGDQEERAQYAEGAEDVRVLEEAPGSSVVGKVDETPTGEVQVQDRDSDQRRHGRSDEQRRHEDPRSAGRVDKGRYPDAEPGEIDGDHQEKGRPSGVVRKNPRDEIEEHEAREQAENWQRNAASEGCPLRGRQRSRP